MNLCEGGRGNAHSEVCYEGSDCPCCALLEVIDNLQSDLAEAEKACKEMSEEIEELKKETRVE